MSIAGYLSSRYNPELRIPKSAEPASSQGKDTKKDTLSIRYDGPILTGEKSVEQQRDTPLREHPLAIPGRSALPLESKPRKSGPGIIWKVRK
jgi:hypothetical protein